MIESEILSGSKSELWQELIQYGVTLSGNDLSDELQHYLITVFDRSFEYEEGGMSFADGSVVMMLSEAQDKQSFAKREALRSVGDVCLLRASFQQFISRAFKRIERNPRQYYVNMGMTTFMMLFAEYERRKQSHKGATYQSVADNMGILVEVLSSIDGNAHVLEELTKRTTVGNVTYL